jgi:primosomal protein N' (replication factor Y)
VQAAVTHDFDAFAERELAERRVPQYPPHVRLVNVIVSSPDQALAATAAEQAAAWIRRGLAKRVRAGSTTLKEVELVGPAPAPIERLHGRWRWHFLLRGGSHHGLGAVCRALAERYRLPSGDIRLALDRDPVALL